MANIAKVLKDEISRISRKEAKSRVAPIKKAQMALKKTVVALQTKIASLEKKNRRLVAAIEKGKEVSPRVSSAATPKVRLTSKNIRSLRKKMKLSQADFAGLVGVTPHPVYLWENKGGHLGLREKTLAALLSISDLGTKEAREKVAALGGKKAA